MKPLIYALTLLFSGLLLCAQETTSTEEPIDSVNLLGLIRQGGWAMYPLGICSIVMFFLIFYSWKETATKKFFVRKQVDASLNALEEGNTQQGLSHLQTSDALLNRAVTPALKKIHKGSEKSESLFIENLEAEENNVAQWVTYLNVVASVAPMIGLLGTVTGMVQVFDAMATQGGNARSMAAGVQAATIPTTETLQKSDAMESDAGT